MIEVLNMTFFLCAKQARLNKRFSKLSGLEIYHNIPFGNQDSQDEAISVANYVVLWKINPHTSPSIQDESISETLEYLILLQKQEPRNPKQNSEKFIIPIEKLHFV